MKDRKIAAFVLILISLITIACSSANNTYQQYKNMEAIAHQGEAVYKQYKTSDPAAAKSALLTYIKDLDGLVQSNHPEQFAFQVDILISYVRLAKLEELKNGTEKEIYMEKAEEQCSHLKTKQENCSSEKLRELVDKMDQVEPK